MSDDSRPGGSPDDLRADSGSEWGDDWEAAFQAEDDIFLPDLDPEPDGDGATAPTPAGDAAPEPPPGEPDGQKETVEDDTGDGRSALLWVLAGAGGGLAVTLAGLGIYLALTGHRPPPSRPRPAAGTTQTPPPPRPAPPATTAPEAAAPTPRRIKVSLRPFLIPVRNQAGNPAGEVLEIGITLVVEPDNGAGTISRTQRTMIRDSIYRLFSAIPSPELHRYTLARGEMVTRVLAAVRKAVPELTIKSLTFDRYHIT